MIRLSPPCLKPGTGLSSSHSCLWKGCWLMSPSSLHLPPPPPSSGFHLAPLLSWLLPDRQELSNSSPLSRSLPGLPPPLQPPLLWVLSLQAEALSQGSECFSLPAISHPSVSPYPAHSQIQALGLLHQAQTLPARVLRPRQDAPTAGNTQSSPCGPKTTKRVCFCFVSGLFIYLSI